MMKRRDCLSILAGATAAAAWPRAARAQGGRAWRVGMLLPAGDMHGSDELVGALAKLGYVRGGNTTFDIRAAGGEPERLPALARALVAGRPDVIVSATDMAARA